MKEKDSWIKIHRGLKDSKIWYYTPAQFKVFMTILMEANWGEGWGRFNREEVKVKPGQMLTSRQHLSDVSGIGKNTVRKTLIKLEQDNVIKLERNSTGSRITVLNWGKYQQTDNRGNSEGYNEGDSGLGSKGDSEGDTKEEEVEEQEEKESIKETGKSAGLKEKANQVFQCWNKTQAGVKHRNLTPPMKKSVNARLKDGYSVQEINQAIQNLAKALNNNSYYWTHRWTLQEFLSRGQGAQVDKFLDGIDDMKVNSKKKNKKSAKAQALNGGMI